jgi:hypothetical protein
MRWKDGDEVEVFLEDIELNGETLRSAQTALVGQFEPPKRGGTNDRSVNSAGSGAAKVDPESK